MDYSLPGSSVLGIFQARVLEWGAIAFSGRKVMTNLDSIFKIYLNAFISDYHVIKITYGYSDETENC